MLNLWPNVPHTTFGFKHIFSFVVFYSVGAYIKLYGSHKTKKIGIIFLKAKITYRPWINAVASTTFGIYLLHDNKLFLHYMWDNVLATYQYYDSILLPLYAILVVALIFVIGMIVDYVRLAFIEKPVMKAITPSFERIQSRVEKVLPL